MDEFDQGHYLTSIFESTYYEAPIIRDNLNPCRRTAYGQFCDSMMSAASHVNVGVSGRWY